MTSVPDRVRLMMADLNLDQPGFAKLAGTSKAMVNHWLTGKVKSISAEFAYNIEKKSDFSARWIQLGSGTPKRQERDELSDRYRSADPATRTLIDIALSSPDTPLPAGLSPSLRVLVDMARTAIKNEQQRSNGTSSREDPDS